jgi:hypothetical protein
MVDLSVRLHFMLVKTVSAINPHSFTEHHRIDSEPQVALETRVEGLIALGVAQHYIAEFGPQTPDGIMHGVYNGAEELHEIINPLELPGAPSEDFEPTYFTTAQTHMFGQVLRRFAAGYFASPSVLYPDRLAKQAGAIAGAVMLGNTYAKLEMDAHIFSAELLTASGIRRKWRELTGAPETLVSHEFTSTPEVPDTEQHIAVVQSPLLVSGSPYYFDYHY